MNTKAQVQELRKLIKITDDVKLVIPWITPEVIEAAGWTIYSNFPTFLGATKQDGELEIRVSYLNKTISGSIKEGRTRKPKGFIADLVDRAAAILFYGYEERPMVNISVTTDCDWRTITSRI